MGRRREGATGQHRRFALSPNLPITASPLHPSPIVWNSIDSLPDLWHTMCSIDNRHAQKTITKTPTVPPPPTSPERRLPLRQPPSEQPFSASPLNVDPVRNDWVLPLLGHQCSRCISLSRPA